MFVVSRQLRSLLAMSVALVSAFAMAAASADAFESKPLEVTTFKMETVKETKEIDLGLGTIGDKMKFVNEPYTYTQAGGHPWGLTTIGEFSNEKTTSGGEEVKITPTQDPKDAVVDLPPGLLGDPMAVPRCPIIQVTDTQEPCPPDTQVGYYIIDFGGKQAVGPVVNVQPEVGQSAEFAIEFAKEPFLLTAHLVRVENKHHEYEYRFTVVSDEQPMIGLYHFELTFWGVPADHSHDPMRGLRCNNIGGNGITECNPSEDGNIPFGSSPVVPFLIMPTDCVEGEQSTTIRTDSWESPGSVQEGEYFGFTKNTIGFPGVTGCNLLQFDTGIEVRPSTSLADEPAGVEFNVKVAQNESTQSPATPEVRDAVVTLPEGMTINPGAVDGIQACNESGPEGINFEGPESEEVGPSGELQLAPGHCPKASKVGTAEAISPLLREPLRGSVFLARPLCGGAGQHSCGPQDAVDGSLYQLYLELGGEGPLANTGINIKLHGYVQANPATGQLTSKFLDNPQAPFSELKLHLNGGPRASLATPAACGPAVATADFTPWSRPSPTTPGTPDSIVSSPPFNVEGCANPTPLQPGFTGGTVTPQAGQFSTFTMDLSRQDREQFVKGVQVHTPPGLIGILSNVPLCGEAQANNGTCPESSKIGTTRVATGAGSHPFEIGGNVYLTGPYCGEGRTSPLPAQRCAPFGLSIVTNAVAGPFNLGLVVVRSRIDVDPSTSRLTVTTDEAGPYAIPQILDGVPLRLRRVTVNIDRPNFIFNPTNCSAERMEATISGTQGARTQVSSPFVVGGCKSLAFKPTFKAYTSAKTSRARGASLDVRLSYPANSVGSEANVARVKVALPKKLPSRLSTLQQACPAAKFQANPALCPKASIVGVVKASTPVLPVGLSGPVYFVSHGGESFPSLVVVLQGDNVRVDLTGSTFINEHTNVTTSTFKTLPDVPVHTFELYLPEGRYSALAATANLCKLAGKLKMPTQFVAQNGARFNQSTNIVVTGCRKAKASRGGSARRGKHGSSGGRVRK
jgi:hypothetical protein